MTQTADLPPLPCPQRRNRLWWSLQVLYQVFVSCWMGYRVRGLEHLPPDGGALLLINHRSFLDPMLVGVPLRRPISFVARHTLFSVPLIGSILRGTYVIPINRDSAGTTSLREIVRRLDHGFIVGLFPEGTRHSGPDPLDTLKPGFVSIFRRASVPVIPVGIAGADKAMPRGAAFIRPRPVRIVFGERIPTIELNPLCERGREQDLLELVAQHMTESIREAESWLSNGS